MSDYADSLVRLARAQVQLGRLEVNERAVPAVEAIVAETGMDGERVEELRRLGAEAEARSDAYRSSIGGARGDAVRVDVSPGAA